MHSININCDGSSIAMDQSIVMDQLIAMDQSIAMDRLIGEGLIDCNG